MRLTIEVKEQVARTREIEIEFPVYRSDWDADDGWSTEWHERLSLLPDGSVQIVRVTKRESYGRATYEIEGYVPVPDDPQDLPSRSIAGCGIDERTGRVAHLSTVEEFVEALAEATTALGLTATP